MLKNQDLAQTGTEPGDSTTQDERLLPVDAMPLDVNPSVVQTVFDTKVVRDLMIERDMRAEPPPPLMQAIAAEIFASCGSALRAGQIAEEIAAIASSAPISCYRKASLALAMNPNEEALSLLERSLHSHESELAWVKVDPRFLPIQNEERFERVASAIG
ncbi:MAG: hypothetical protein WB524_15400 [Acidobacteriaceae bacterium]